jgi:hypothetical protein
MSVYHGNMKQETGTRSIKERRRCRHCHALHSTGTHRMDGENWKGMCQTCQDVLSRHVL